VQLLLLAREALALLPRQAAYRPAGAAAAAGITLIVLVFVLVVTASGWLLWAGPKRCGPQCWPCTWG
jgi:hypothetical protein